ncbi:helix-turn-helix domain-containing protein [Natrinema versiforme]|uniref:Bacterio-opsin activator n=1 Tax=Natrinema versiforme TaxID=88724 RepID=A0A4P8WLY0_9EURY|nr:helix-turn-helix domain-containing protein [Natrinema versiforme]QCS44587.1 bacterio-opsin activator [Natrinema versiforme]
MPITAEVHLRSPLLPLVSLANLEQANQVQCPHVIGLNQGHQQVVVEIDAAEPLSVETLLELDDVFEATDLGTVNGRHVFKVASVLKESVAEAFDNTPDAGLIGAIQITPEGWYEQKVFKDYPAFNTFRTSCEEHGISVEIGSISQDTSASEESAPYGLTERQYEALSLAMSRGYYEQPRQTSARELADELGISQPSLSDLLGRAERQLISATLGSPTRLEVLSQ